MREAREQQAVVEWCAWKRIPIFHIPNGGSRDKREAANLKRQGVKPGVPDLFVPVARGGWHGLFVEMKTAKGRVSPKQREWLELLSAQGYLAKVCRGADEAIRVIGAYMSLRHPSDN